jgi:cell division protein FtsW
MLRAGQVVQLVVMALLGLAVVMVASASMTVAGAGNAHDSIGAILCSKQSLYALAAVAALFLGSRLGPVLHRVPQMRAWTNPVLWALGLSLVLVAATMVPGIGVTFNGAHRWLRLGPAGWGLTFQPSELVKWSVVISVALWCATHQDMMREFKRGLLPPLLLLGLACALIVKDDLGTAALVGIVAAVLLAAGGARLWQLGLMIPPAAGIVAVAIAHSAYRRARLTSFLNPWADPMHNGYQAIQSMLAVAQGGLFGRGLGNGVQRFGYLPTDSSDFLFAIICEDLGLGGALLVAGLFLILIWAGLRIVLRCQDMFTRLVALGVIMTVGLQAVINMAVVTVVVPTKGIALPLLSAGATGWIATAFALGLVAGLDPKPGVVFDPEAQTRRESAKPRGLPEPSDSPSVGGDAHVPA